METNEIAVRQKMIETILIRLGGEEIDVELSDKEIDTCIDLALRKLKQRSDAFVEESLVLLKLVKNQKEYVLPNEIIEVMKIYRRGYTRAFGSTSGSNLDPFALSFYSIYAGGIYSQSGVGSPTSYELYHNYMKTIGKQMGMYMNYSFNPNTHKLVIAENPRADDEVILLHSFVDKPVYELLQDRYCGLWIENWAYAECLNLLSKARGRFASLAGPLGQAPTQDNADLKTESKEMKEQLEKELQSKIPGGDSVTYGLAPYFG